MCPEHRFLFEKVFTQCLVTRSFVQVSILKCLILKLQLQSRLNKKLQISLTKILYQKLAIQVFLKQLIIGLILPIRTYQEAFINYNQMQCSMCRKTKSSLCKKCHEQSLRAKVEEIDKLKIKLELAKTKYNETLSIQFLQSSEYRIKKSSSAIKYGDNKQSFDSQIKQILKKQAVHVSIKKATKMIQQKRLLLQRLQQQRKLKLSRIAKYQDSVSWFKRETTVKSAQKINQIKERIKAKSSSLKRLSQTVSFFIHEIFYRIFGIAWRIHENFISFQKRTLFKIKKVEELDFLNYNKEQDPMANSVYELQNVEQIYIKNKTNQKGLHVLFQNIIILTILQKIFNVWLPYPIHCDVSFNQSKLITKIEEITICGKKLIDFSMCVQISKNIIQFFPSKIKSERSKISEKVQNQEDYFQFFQINQLAQYNKRKIELNKLFINCLQINIEYLSLKHGIEERPLVFLDPELIKKVVKDFKMHKLYVQRPKTIRQHLQREQKYRSMLKQIKMSTMLQLLQKSQGQWGHDQEQIEYEFGKKICQEQEELQNDLTSDQKYNNGQKMQAVDLHTKQYELSNMQTSVYQLCIPQGLHSVKSNETDNDEFQLLV